MQILYKDNSSLKQVVDYLTSLNTPHMVIIEKPKRSTAQNRTYWDNVGIIADYTGYTPEEASTIIKHSITQSGKLVMMKYEETKQGIVQLPKSTADIDTKEFGILLDYVFQMWQAMKLQMNDPWLLQYAEDLFK